MSSEAGIVTRYLRLRKQVLEPSESGVTFEGLIDALMVLYEEVNSVKSKNRSQTMTSFISTFQNVVHNYKKLRVNIGDFKVIRVIGRGNFADVQLAKERSSGKVYALKVMRKVGEKAPAFYCEERDIMASNSSPWLTKLDYAFQDSGHLYLAMEFHCGGDLLTLLDRHDNRLEESSVRFYTAEVALGIHDLHKMGFVHRDIKPENILIDRTGHLKLADFGNAARLSTAGTVNKVMPVGTPDYIAPEVLQCLQSGEESHGVECDYWSLGILAFEMFHGASPFTDLEGSVINTYANIMRAAEKPVAFPPDTPRHLAALVEGLLKPPRSRLGHSQLLRHPFYSALDWSNLQGTTPPHVPQVSGEDDDSNFEHLEEVSPSPDISSLKPSKEFRNLPFVGFTFTSDKGKVRSLEAGDSAVLEGELKTKAAELEKIKLKNFHLEQQALNHTRTQEGSVRDFEQVEKLTTQLNMAEQDNAELKSTVRNMERILEIERQDRAATEQKTISLLEDVRRKWSKAEEERMEGVRKELLGERERAEELESRWRESVSQLKKTRSELEAVAGVKNQLKTKLKDYKQRLENVASLDQLRSKEIAKLEDDKKEADAEISLCRSQLNESRMVEGRTDALQLIIEQRDQILAEKNSELKMKTSEVDAFATQVEDTRKKLKAVEEKLKEKTKEAKSLKEELDCAKNESRVEVESQLGVHTQLKTELKDIMKENAEVKSKIKTVEAARVGMEVKKEASEKELKTVKAELEKVKEERDREVTEKEVVYKKKMKNLEQIFETLQAKIDKLEKKGRSESGTDLKKKQIHELECLVEKLEVEKAKTKNELSEAVGEKETVAKHLAKARTDIESLKREHAAEVVVMEKSLSEKSVLAVELEDVATLRDENEKLTAELKEVKLDLRIEKRELEKKSNLVTFIREREHKNKEKLEAFEKEKTEFEKEIVELKSNVKSLDEATENLKKQEDKLANFTADIRKVKDEKNEVVIENRRLKTDASSQDAKIAKLEKAVSKLEEERETLVSLRLNNEALLEASSELEKQVLDYEKLNERLEGKLQVLQTGKREFEVQLDREKEETRKAKISVNEGKSSKIHLESQLKEARRKMEEDERNRDTEKADSSKHLKEYKALCQKLSATMEDLNRDNVNKEQFGKVTERAKLNLEVENVQLKEELSDLITQLNSHKESNFKLKLVVEESIKKIEAKNEDISNMQITVEAETRTVAEQLMRHQATQAQQAKLIDFLQTKVNTLEGRKKTLSDKIFGNKENARPGQGSQIPMAYSEVEAMLEKEKSKGRKLTQQLSRARAEVVALKTNQPEHQEIPAAVMGQVDPKAHNIPHRLCQATNKKSTKCPVCQESIGFMAMCQVCRDCQLCVHASCSTSLPPTCGLPTQMLAALSSVPSIASRPLPPAPESGNRKEGAVQTLVGGSWRESVLVLSRTNMLDLYTDSSKASRIDQVGLTLPNCRVSVQSTVAYNEVYHLNTTDRPYTFKLTTHTTGQPEKVLYFMCHNFAAKVEWVNRLEEVIRSSPHNLSPPSACLPEGSSRRLVCSLPPPHEVLAAARVGDQLVLGTTQGLGVLTKDGVAHCLGLSSPVHSIQHLATLNLLVLATGGDGLPSQLVTVSSLSLTAPLQPVAVTAELARCHTFSCLESSKGKVFLCAVSEDLVVILEWSAKRGSFVLRNKFSTDQPTAAIEFTDHSVLVGTTKFYEIDLKSFSAEEFLDLTDPGIKSVVGSQAFNGSLPRSVMKLEQEGGEVEYLLAFTRHVLFVDSFGQQTRPHVLLERLPLEHGLLGDTLVTSYCDMIELRPLADVCSPSQLTASSPHLLATVQGELLFSHQDTASNNLTGIRLEPDI